MLMVLCRKAVFPFICNKSSCRTWLRHEHATHLLSKQLYPSLPSAVMHHVPWSDWQPFTDHPETVSESHILVLSILQTHSVPQTERQKHNMSSRWLRLPWIITISQGESIQHPSFPPRHLWMDQLEILSSVCQVNINMNIWGQGGNLSFFFCYASTFNWFV